MTPQQSFQPALDAARRARLATLCEKGWSIFERFDREVRDRRFHSFVASDYDAVLAALIEHRGSGLRFLEWGSASGVITIMADLLGYDAVGIELDSSLTETARQLAEEFDSQARFVEGSFLPTGYRFRPRNGTPLSEWVDTSGPSAYVTLGSALDEFDVVFGFPWGGEEPMMLDLMRCYGRPDALLLLHSVEHGVQAYRGGRPQSTAPKR